MSIRDSETEAMAVGIVVLGVFLLGVLGGFLIGIKSSDDDWKTEIVRRDHAVWVVKPNGKTEFKWKVEKQ